ncbi:hypothetical protein MJO28_006528 [Puccinia striiformis f. sp. tritici]|uniref:Uncharacterized protein n=1 Tax=Puccinia striiformis f. sp. tritici TaxID=168172 RepID=A0ACC0EKP4_9BASI|nr:hypothetical protein MJO28_006528 [Puccinia striiformis f. sp. tritici]
MVSLSNDSLCDSFGFKSESLEVVSHGNDRLKANFFHKVGSRLANVLFDTGAGSSYVSEKFLALESLSTFSSPVPFAVTGAFAFRKEMKKKNVKIFVCTSIDDALNVLGPREKIIASLPETFSSSEPFGSKLRSALIL